MKRLSFSVFEITTLNMPAQMCLLYNTDSSLSNLYNSCSFLRDIFRFLTILAYKKHTQKKSIRKKAYTQKKVYAKKGKYH